MRGGFPRVKDDVSLSPHPHTAVSSIIIQEEEGEQRPIYYVLADFVNELTPNSLEEEEVGANKEWMLSIDGSSNKKCSGAGIIIEGLSEVLIEQSLCFEFRASNNQAEYKVLLAGIRLAKELGTTMLTIKSDPQLVIGQVNGEYQAKDLQLTRYLVLEDPQDARRIKREATKYVLIAVEHAIKEVHEGACGSHIGGRALANKIARAGFYWPTIKKDSLAFVKNAPSEQLHLVTSSSPSYMWGMDILGPFPLAIGQVKFLSVAVDYFTKWIEVKLIATISVERVRHFYWRRIVCHFELSIVIVSDNDTQFASRAVVEFCVQYGIKESFTSVEHP
ncbi:hypothetical protein CR513_05776, partial [Mucuna pruriens]